MLLVHEHLLEFCMDDSDQVPCDCFPQPKGHDLFCLKLTLLLFQLFFLVSFEQMFLDDVKLAPLLLLILDPFPILSGK